jgi:hypothetical protein
MRELQRVRALTRAVSQARAQTRHAARRPTWLIATSDARSRRQRRRAQPRLSDPFKPELSARQAAAARARPPCVQCRAHRCACAIIGTEISPWISEAVAVAVVPRRNTRLAMAARLIQLPSRRPLRSVKHSHCCSGTRRAFSLPATPRRIISCRPSLRSCALIIVASLACQFTCNAHTSAELTRRPISSSAYSGHRSASIDTNSELFERLFCLHDENNEQCTGALMSWHSGPARSYSNNAAEA